MNTTLRYPTRAPRRRQGGLSLVELMVGIAVGMFVVAAATTLVSSQLSDNRRLLLETQLQQDLRASMDIITRQLRRAGAMTPVFVEAGIAASPVAGGASNPWGAMTFAGSASAAEVQFRFKLDEDQSGPFGFKLDDGAIKTRIRVGASNDWQFLTDTNVLTVTSFSITPRILSSVALPCPNMCADGTTNCWPQLQVRSFVVDIQARAKSDPAVQRGLRNEVRVRNDLVDFNGPTPSSLVCPV